MATTPMPRRSALAIYLTAMVFILVFVALMVAIATAGRVLAQPAAETRPTVASCTATSSSSTCLASAARWFLMVENTSASTDAACAFGDTAVMNSTTSFMLYAGEVRLWSGRSGTAPPAGALNCVTSSGSATIRIEWL